MGSIGAPEIIVVFIVALLVLGPDRLPKAARQMGKAVGEFRRLSSGFQDEVRRAIDTDESDESREAATTDEPGDPSASSEPATQPTTYVPPPTESLPQGRTRPMTPADTELPPPPDDPSYN